MCMTSASAVPGSIAEALRLADASLDYLNSSAAADASGAACGQVLTALGGLRAKLTAAHAEDKAIVRCATGGLRANL